MDKVKPFLVVLAIVVVLVYVFYSLTYSEDERLGKGIHYNHDWQTISTGSKGVPNVPPTVIEFHRNKKHIIVKQKPYQFAPDFDGWRDVVYPAGYDTVYYWLIVKSDHLFIGPLDSLVFEQKRQEYNVSDKLKFND